MLNKTVFSSRRLVRSGDPPPPTGGGTSGCCVSSDLTLWNLSIDTRVLCDWLQFADGPWKKPVIAKSWRVQWTSGLSWRVPIFTGRTFSSSWMIDQDHCLRMLSHFASKNNPPVGTECGNWRGYSPYLALRPSSLYQSSSLSHPQIFARSIRELYSVDAAQAILQSDFIRLGFGSHRLYAPGNMRCIW